MHAMFRQIGGYLYVRLIFMIFICMIHGAEFFFRKIMFSYILQIQTNL